MRHNPLINVASAVVLVTNLLSPVVAAAAEPDAAQRWPIATSESLSALPGWFTVPPAVRSGGPIEALPAWFTASSVDSQPLQALPRWFASPVGNGAGALPVANAAPAESALPRWFAPQTRPAPEAAGHSPAASSASNSMSALPAWFAPLAGPSDRQAEVAAAPRAPAALPGWFGSESQPAASADFQPMQTHIDESLLSVNVFGPGVANVGSPVGAGELYTAVIQNSSVFTAYSIYLTAAHQNYFNYDGFSQIITAAGGLNGPVPFNLSSDPTTLTWTPSIPVNLLPGTVLTLNFTLRAACDAQSGQQMRVGLYYITDPITPTYDLNTGGLNITTGRGNLVISKSPAVQTIDTTQFGHPITWVVTVQNTGLGALFGAIVTDTGSSTLSQPSGDLTPSVTITRMEINESRNFTVVGLVNACNFTNIAQASWTCGNGNLAGDGFVTNPVSSTAGVLFKPELPNIALQISPPSLAFSYCSQVTQTVIVSVTNTGGPAGSFVLNSGFPSDGFMQLITSSVSAGWQYAPASGSFTYLGGTPTGTIPAQTTTPITLSFQVAPKSAVCIAGNGNVHLNASYKDVCSGDAYQTPGQMLSYQYAQGEAPSLQVTKDSTLPGDHLAHSGDVITYVIRVQGVNPGNLRSPVFASDTLPNVFQITGTTMASRGAFTLTGQTLRWSFSPPGGLGGATINEALTYTVQVVPLKNQCDATQQANNTVVITATPTCASCGTLTASAQDYAVIVNNEGIQAGQGGSATSAETCGLGFTFVNSYTVAGSTVITWAGALYTDSLGIDVGFGALPGGASPLYLTGGVSASIGGTSYLLTPTINPLGQLTLDLTPLQAQHAPTQNLTLILTYSVAFTEGILSGSLTGYSQNFYDWSQLYLPNVSTQGCATNNAYNQARYLSVQRGELQVGMPPPTVDQCQTTHVSLSVNDLTGRHTHDTVITFTASTAQIASARNFTFTGSLASFNGLLMPAVNPNIGGGRGVITFTLDPAFSVTGNGTIEFDIDPNCQEKPAWTAGIAFQTQCNVRHSNSTQPGMTYNSPDIGLFVTPLEYTIDTKNVVWWVLVSNKGAGPATNILVTNTLNNLSVLNYTYDNTNTVVAYHGAQPISSTNPVSLTISRLNPNESVLISLTGTVMACDPLSVDIAANLSCFGTVCQTKSAHVKYDAPPVYLTSNNGQTADLPLCALGTVLFRTKNASPSATLYNATVTETMIGLAPAPGYPMTVTVVSVTGTVLASTTSFTPASTTQGNPATSQFTTTLVWKYDDPLANGILDAVPPQASVIVSIPVRLGCSAGTPKAQADASMFGPCNVLKTAHEDAITLQTREPDMRLTKTARDLSTASQEGSNIAANPGDAIVWHLHLLNNDNGKSYPAQNVVLTDTWPDNFAFIAGSSNVTAPITDSQSITWNIGVIQVGQALDFYITGTVKGTACEARTVNFSRLTYGCDGGCVDGLAPFDEASLDTNPDVSLSLSPGPLETCQGDLPIIIRNYGARALSPTLAINLPVGFVYSNIVSYSPGLTLTNILTDSQAPQFQFAEIPERTSAPQGVNDPSHGQIAPSTYTLTLRVNNSGASGVCPVPDGGLVTAALGYDNSGVCISQGPFTSTASTSLNVVTPHLQISKIPHTQVGRVGQTVTWTLMLTDTGPGIAENMLVTDVAGANYTNLAGSVDSYGAAPTLAGNTLVWTLTQPITSGGVWSAQVSAVLTNTGDGHNVVTATAGCASGCQSAFATDTAMDSLVDAFGKGPKIQTGTIGSQVVFTFTAFLPAKDRLYGGLSLTDTLPAGLGYSSSNVTYYDNNSATPVITDTPSITPGMLASGPVIWAFGNLSGAVQISGLITAVVLNIPANKDGASVTNVLTMTYVDSGMPYVFTDTAQVQVVEPKLTLNKAVNTSTGSSNNLDGRALLTYTLRLTNTGTYTASDVFVTDTIPAGISVTALLDSYPHSAPVQGLGTLTWTVDPIGNVAPNNVAVLTYTAVISGAASGQPLTNTAHATYRSLPGGPPQVRTYPPLTSSQTLNTVVLTTTKTVVPASPVTNHLRIGDLVTYTIAVTVPAGEVAYWPRQTDLLPIGFHLVTGTLAVVADAQLVFQTGAITLTAPVTTAVGGAEQMSWLLNTVTNTSQAAGGLITTTFQARITGRTPAGADTADLAIGNNLATNTENWSWSLQDTGSYTAALALTRTASVGSQVSNPSLTIGKTAVPAQGAYVGANDTITYTLVITNAGRAPAYDIVISDVLPSGIIYDSSTLTSATPASAAFTVSPTFGATGVITWGVTTLNGIDLSPNPLLTITVNASVISNIAAHVRLTNTVNIPYYDSQPGNPIQRVYADGSSSVWHQTANAGFSKAVTFSPPPTATLGSLVTYILSLPPSPISATLYNVQVTDTIRSTLAILSVATGGGGTGASSGWAGQVVTAAFSTIPNSSQAFVTVTARIADGLGANAGTNITNSATLSFSTASAITTTGVVTTLVGEPRLTLANSAASSTGSLTNLDGGALLTYTLRLTNTGTSPAYSVLVTDSIPSGISVTAQFGGDSTGPLAAGPGQLTWLVNTISSAAPNNVTVLTYTAVVSQALVRTALTNVVHSTYWSLTDTTPGARFYGPLTATQTVTTTGLVFSKLTTPPVLRVGDVVTYSLVFTVPAGETGLGGSSYLTDVLPAGVIFIIGSDGLTNSPAGVSVNTTAFAAGVSGASQALTWTFGTPVTSLQTQPTVVTLTFQAQATGAPVDGSAAVWPTQTLIYGLTNTAALIQNGVLVSRATAGNTVVQPQLAINKTSSPPNGAFVGANDPITYALTIVNSGFASAYDLVITDTLPAGIHYVDTFLNTNPAGAIVTPTIAGQAITYAVSELAAQAAMVITVVAQVDANVGAGLFLTNTAGLPSYDSQPGPGPQEGLTPSQRVYSDGFSSAWHQTVSPGLTKTVMPAAATLGTVLTYVIAMPSPLISVSVDNAVVTDVLDPRLQLAAVIIDGVDGAVAQAGNDFTVTYGSAIGAQQQRLITVTAVLSDPLSAQRGDVITNVAVLSHATGITVSNQPFFTVVEPLLSPYKTSNVPLTTTVLAGQSVTYTIRLTNSGLIPISPAYALAITDTLPVGMRQGAPAVEGVDIGGVSAGGFVTTYTPATGQLTIVFPMATAVGPGEALALTYTAQVDADVPAGLLMTNLMSATYSSLPGNVPGIRTYGPITASTPLNTPVATMLLKAVAPPTVTIGSPVVFTLTVPGTPLGAALLDVLVVDQVDSRLQVIAATAVGGVNAQPVVIGQNVLVTFDSVPPDSQATIRITAIVSDQVAVVDGTQIPNVAVMDYTGNPLGPIPSNIVTTTVAEPMVTLAKTVLPPRNPVGADDLVTYQLTLNSTGDWPAYDILVTDTLPAGLDFVAVTALTVTDPVTNILGTYPVWRVPQLNVGGTAFITFTARVADSIAAGLWLTNTASGQYDSQPGTPPVQRIYPLPPVSATIQSGQPALELTKTAAPTPAQAGGALTYTLTVTNTGRVSATSVILTDLVPINTTYSACGPASTGCGHDVSTGMVSWSLGTLNLGQPRSVTMTVDVTAPLPDGTLLTNIARVTSAEGVTQTFTLTTPVLSAHALSLVKTVSPPGFVASGEWLTYTLNWAVSGREAALGVVINDPVPAGTIYQAASSPSAFDGTSVSWPLGDHFPGDSGAVSFTVQIIQPWPNLAVITNVAIITDTNRGLTSTASVTSTVLSHHTLDVHKSAAPDPVPSGGLLTYTLAYTATGDDPVFGVTLSDQVPAHAAFFASPQPYSQAGNLVIWPLGTLLAAGSGLTEQTGVVTMVVRVDSPLANGWIIPNSVLITDTSGLTHTASVTTTIIAPLIALQKTMDNAGPIYVGDLVTFTLRLTNMGGTPLATIPLTDAFDTNYLSFVSAAPGPDGVSGGLLTWNNVAASPLPVGAALSVQVVMRAINITPAGAPTLNTAVVNGVIDIYGQTPPGSSSSSPVSVTILPGLAISKRVLGTPPFPVGGLISFSIQITNLGSTTFITLPLADTYDPNYLGYVRAIPAPDVVTSGQLNWNNLVSGSGGLLPGATISVQVVFTAVATVSNTINTATVSDAVGTYGTSISLTTGTGIPTPVTLLYFRIDSMNGAQVNLAWQTAMEVDNYGFSLYRSPVDDRSQATLIDFEPAAPRGGSSQGRAYHYTDSVPSDGVWWYWLADVDTHGQETFHGPVHTGVNPSQDYRYHFYLPLIQNRR